MCPSSLLYRSLILASHREFDFIFHLDHPNHILKLFIFLSYLSQSPSSFFAEAASALRRVFVSLYFSFFISRSIWTRASVYSMMLFTILSSSRFSP